jgi:hypothetical protein
MLQASDSSSGCAAISINLELDVKTVAKTITQDYLLRR